MLLARPRARVLVALSVALTAVACGTDAGADPDTTPVTTASISATATATVEPSASASASAPAASGEAEGWERYESAEGGFAIELPRGWEAADLTSGDIDAMVDLLDDDPRLAPMADQLPTMLEQGVAFFAVQIGSESLDSGFATNLNVVVQEGIGMSLEMYTAGNISFIEETFGVDTTREDVKLPIGDGVRVDYETTFPGTPEVHQTQFYFVDDDDRALIATFSRAAGSEYEALDDEFAAIIETMELLP